MQIPGGRLIERFGPRTLCSIGLLGTGLINLITPFLVDHFSIFIASRIFIGAIQATIFSSCYALVTKWIPEHERSTALSLSAIGSAFGSMFTSSMAGYLCMHYHWALVFYASGLITTAIGLVYLTLVTDDPRYHSLVSRTEYEYIVENIAGSRRSKKQPSYRPFPWVQVLTSRPLWAAIFLKLTMGFIYSLVMLKIPAYLSQVMQMSIDEVGYSSALIFGVKGFR